MSFPDYQKQGGSTAKALESVYLGSNLDVFYYVTLGKLFNLSKPHFLHLQNGEIIVIELASKDSYEDSIK